MEFKVSLSSFQIDAIASVTADKVLQTVEYARKEERWYESEIKSLKTELQKRDSLLAQKELMILRQREHLKRYREELEVLKNLEKK